MDIGVDLYAAFLLPRLRMASDSREDKVGEQADCRRIDNLQPVYPTGRWAVLKTLNILFLYRFGQSFMFQLAACMNSAPYDKCQSGYWQSGCIADKYVSTMQLADKVKPL